MFSSFEITPHSVRRTSTTTKTFEPTQSMRLAGGGGGETTKRDGGEGEFFFLHSIIPLKTDLPSFIDALCSLKNLCFDIAGRFLFFCSSALLRQGEDKQAFWVRQLGCQTVGL